MNNVILNSVITCPYCGFAKGEEMPIDACQFLTGRFRPLRSVEITDARRVRAALQRELPARAAVGTMRGDPAYVERATEGTECLPAKLGRAIDCMRLIAGRTKFAHSLALSLQ
jgi:hypothetical protein